MNVWLPPPQALGCKKKIHLLSVGHENKACYYTKKKKELLEHGTKAQEVDQRKRGSQKMLDIKSEQR